VALDDNCDGAADGPFGENVTQDAGECVVYKICVTNTGEQALNGTGVTVSDAHIGFTDINFGSIAVGAPAVCKEVPSVITTATQCADGKCICEDVQGTNTASISSAVCVNTQVNACDQDGSICEDTATVECVSEAICRTPGFWMTHGCGTTGTPLYGPCEGKTGSQNITQQVINACGGCLDVCGRDITDTATMSYDSAIEAMCDNPGKPIFHLTAMALNCCISGFGSDCSGGDAYLSNLFAEANNSCAMGGSYRKDEVDCWNNGGKYDNGKCWYGTCEGTDTLCKESTWDCNCISFPNNCHEMDLCNEDMGLCFDEGKPAGSAKACTAAKKNGCNVFDGTCTSGTLGGSCVVEP
jgi:hypothetical protein